MADIKMKYDAAEDITITLASLADDTTAASSEIDNTSDLYEDYLVRFSIKTGASGVSASGKIFFYAAGAIDDSGRTYPTNNKGQIPLGLPMSATANATTYTSDVYSVRMAFNGVIPAYFKVVVDNQTGTALDSTEGNHDKRGQGVWRQTV
jgi:hypothetical protein